jgi:hypothetical protein
MDFITGLPQAQGKDCIYVVVDRLTKFAHFFSIPSKYSAAHVAELFFREVFKLHGLPKTIVSDRDSRFMEGFWQEIFRLVGIELTPNMSYHSQTDGQTEIVNKWLEGYLRNYVSGQQKAWIKWLHLRGALLQICPIICQSGCHPSGHYMDTMPLHLLTRSLGRVGPQKPKDWIQESQDILKTLKDNLEMARNQQKMYADRHRVERNFEVGDLVYLRLQPY